MAWLATVLLPLVTAPAHAQEAGEERRAFSLLDNGDFDEEPAGFVDEHGIQRIPWWRSTHGADRLIIPFPDGTRALRTGRGEAVWQPVAVYVPWIGEFAIRGEVQGRGLVTVQDGASGRATIAVSSEGSDFAEFEITAADIERELGRPPTARFVLNFRGDGNDTAFWRALDARVVLPSPSKEALREEILDELRWIIDLWLTNGIDNEPPVQTGFVCFLFDVITGERLYSIPGGYNIVADLLLDGTGVDDDPRWQTALDKLVADLLARGQHPETGMLRTWDAGRDKPNDSSPFEIAGAFGYLLDLSERGPEDARGPAFDAARRVGEAVMARGILPDGEVAAKYVPANGAPDMSSSQLRRLHVPAQLARLGARLEREDYLIAAREAVANLEYTHAWPGTWRDIDPGFDDNYGNYGSRALVMWKAWPEEQMFRRIAYGGYEHYAPIWHDALVFGGNIAADQVRCWKLFKEICELEPGARPRVARLLRLAARSHFKGQQYGNGAWGDVTIIEFNPKDNLQVGDTKGVPQNLLYGLALAHDPAFAAEEGGPDLEEVRAMFTAVLRSSQETYRREHGYLSNQRQVQGTNESIGSLRLAVGLVEMLKRLE